MEFILHLNDGDEEVDIFGVQLLVNPWSLDFRLSLYGLENRIVFV